MNPATKAALYNALLFPGWGHIYLKKYKIGKMGKGIASPCPILLVLLFMVLLWVFSIIDAYQLGKKQMQQSTAPTKT
ncbi:MAG: hypothetical protein HGA29_02110 [Syntrophaceae bacterium]|nr:hypothetical protein [Syntrophaceae bacterium]